MRPVWLSAAHVPAGRHLRFLYLFDFAEVRSDFRLRFVQRVIAAYRASFFLPVSRGSWFRAFLPQYGFPTHYSYLAAFAPDTEIDVMAVDHQKKQVFAGECKYHNKPVDATVYYELEEKVKKSAELRTAFPGYKILYGLFSKSGFTQRMLDQAEGRDDILLIQEDHIL